MNRREEMLLKWQDGSLSSDEQRELNALLAQPEARAQLVREFQFDTLAREVLREAQAEATATTAAQEFEKRLVHHFLVLGFHDGVAQRQRGAGGAEHHADEDRQQADGDHEFEQRETSLPGTDRTGDHGWYMRP